MVADVVLQDRSMIPEYVLVCVYLRLFVLLLSQHVWYMLACACVFSKQQRHHCLCCSKRASAGSDGGDSLEVTHQRDAITFVRACVCMEERLCVCSRE